MKIKSNQAIYVILILMIFNSFANANISNNFEDDCDIQLTTVMINNVSCIGDQNGMITVFPTGGEGEYEFIWSNGTETFFNTQLGTGNYNVTVTDSLGCQATGSFSVGEPTPILNTLEITNETCTLGNANVTITSTGGNGPSYSYGLNGGNITSNNYFENLSAGFHSISVRDEKYCFSEISFEITNTESPIAQASTNQVLSCCSFVALYGAGINNDTTKSFLWTTIDGTIEGPINEQVAMASAEGMYYFQVTDNNSGCSAIDSVFVEGYEDPIVAIENSATCGDTAAVFQTGIYSNSDLDYVITWTNPDGDIILGADSTYLEVDEPGVYIFSFNTLQTCCTYSYEIPFGDDFIINQIPQIENFILNCDQPTAAICLEQNNSNIYKWEGPNNFSSNNRCVDLTEPGDYCVSFLNFNTFCFSDTICFNIINEVPILSLEVNTNFDPVIRCDNQDLTFESIVNFDNAIIEWYYNDDTDPLSTESTISVTESGTYTINASSTDNSCTITEEIIVTDPPSINITEIQENVSCNGEDNGSIAINIIDSNDNFTILWDTGSEEFTVDNLAPGFYHNTITDNYGCQISNTYAMNEPEAMTQTAFSVSPDSDNQGIGSISISIEGGVEPYTIALSTGGSLNGLIQGVYYVTVTDNDDCSAEFGPFTIDNIVGLNVLLNDINWDITPNPFSENIFINTEGNHKTTSIKIIDITGKTIIYKTIPEHIQNYVLNTEDLHRGLYILQMISDHKTQGIKLIKQ